MKGFLIFIAIVIGSVIWVKDWVASGKMDIFIAETLSPSTAPKVLHALIELYSLTDDPKKVQAYGQWLVKEFPDYTSASRVRWKLGQAFEQSGLREQAMQQYMVLKDSFTATEAGRLAQGRWQQMKF